LLARSAAFAAGSLPFLIAQLYVSHSSGAEAIPDIFTLDGGFQSILGRLGEGFRYLAGANTELVWWMPHQVIEILTGKAGWLILSGIGWALLPLVVIGKLGCQALSDAARDVRVVGAVFLVVMPLFLFMWTGCSDYIYVLEPRYYLVTLPMFILVAYQLAIPVEPNGTRLDAWLSRAIGDSIRIKLMAISKDRWHLPSNKTTYEFSPGRAFIVDLLRANPKTVLVTNHEEWFYAEPTIDQSRIRRPKDLRATCVSGPARLLIAIQDHDPGPLTRVAWFGHYDQRWIADYFDGISDIQLLREFPAEEIRVVEARVKQGERIALKKETARIKNF
jgi:hypothetical protein